MIISLLVLTGFLARSQTKSVFDLRGESFERPHQLNGDWDFFWMRFIESNDTTSRWNNMKVPADWYDAPNEDRYSTVGYATYRTTVLLDKRKDEIGIFIPHIFSAYKVIVNGQVAHESTKVGKTEAEYIPFRMPKVVPISRYGENEFEIIIQVSNFNHFNSGMHYAIDIGKYRALQQDLSIKIDVNLFVAGGLFITGFVLLAFAFTYKHLKVEIPFYALFSISLMYRMLGSDPYPLHALFPGLPYIWSVHMEYFSIHTATLFGGLFVFYLYPRQTNKYVKYLYVGVSLVSLACVFVLRPLVFTYLMKFYLFFVLAYVLIFIYIIAKARKEKELSSGYLLTALIIVAIWTLFQIILFLNVAPIPYFINIILVSLIMVFCNLALFRTFMLKIQSVDLTQADLTITKSKQNMLSLISHEIKTPVATLQMNIEMLRAMAQTGKDVPGEMLDKITEACSEDVDDIKQMVNDFVYFMSRADAGIKPTSISEISHRLKNRFSSDTTPMKVYKFNEIRRYDTDLLTLEYIISTLLSNAQKYSPSGAKKAELILREDSQMLTIEVKDYGFGMDEDQVENLGKSRLVRNEKDEISGVGFYLAKELSNQLDHSLVIESKPGLGTSVRIELKGHD